VRDANDIDHDASVAAIKARPDVVCGVKLRMVSPDITELGIDLPLAAKAIASEAAVPMMVHVGDITEDHPVAGRLTPRLLSEILTAGDIVTHTLSFHVGALLTGDKLLPQVWEAREKGVIFDVGVGRANFSFDSARKVLEQGFLPDTISSVSLGLSLEEVVRMTTSKPAEVIGLSDNIGSLAVDREADISILEVVEGEWLFHDVTGGTNTGSLAIRPVACIRAGEMMPIDYGPHPWGWLPESTSTKNLR